MSDNRRFSMFMGDQIALYDRAVARLRTDPAWVAATCRRALLVLRAYPVADEGQEILIETAIEQFEELLLRLCR